MVFDCTGNQGRGRALRYAADLLGYMNCGLPSWGSAVVIQMENKAYIAVAGLVKRQASFSHVSKTGD